MKVCEILEDRGKVVGIGDLKREKKSAEIRKKRDALVSGMKEQGKKLRQVFADERRKSISIVK